MTGLGSWLISSPADGQRHDPTSQCHSIHCYSCHLDHVGTAWRWCLECGHAYHTKRGLRRAYHRATWAALSRQQPWLRGNNFHPSIAAEVWRAATIRADQINYCPLCLHDI